MLKHILRSVCKTLHQKGTSPIKTETIELPDPPVSYEAPQLDDDDPASFMCFRKEPAKFLPEGWTWIHWADGSGHLFKDGMTNSFFSYDRAPYANAGGIEYKRTADEGWNVFWGRFEEFVKFAEDEMAKGA